MKGVDQCKEQKIIYQLSRGDGSTSTTRDRATLVDPRDGVMCKATRLKLKLPAYLEQNLKLRIISS